MKISHLVEKKVLVIEFTEELDHHASEKIRRRVDYEIQRFMPRKVIFDFNNVLFMDSAGIGLIIGRYKTVSLYGGQVSVMNINEKLKKVFDMAGIFRIMNILEDEESELCNYKNF